MIDTRTRVCTRCSLYINTWYKYIFHTEHVLHERVARTNVTYDTWNLVYTTWYVGCLRFKNPPKRKPLQKQLAACRVKEDHPTLCDDAAVQWLFGEQMCHAHPVLHRLAQRPHPCLPLLLHLMMELMTTLKIPKKTSCRAGKRRPTHAF